VELKDYQIKAIERISEFLELAKKLDGDHELSYLKILNRELEEVKYHNSFNCPFVCVKIPTGGGKTFVACHAIQKIMQEYLQGNQDKGIVVWFTPSDEIKTQTLRKLNNKQDPHRKALDEAFSNNIKIFSNEDALRIKESDPQNDLCIIVASLDAFRKEKGKRDKYKVYQENGELMSFFDGVVDDSKLEKDESGPIFSLANVIRLYNPLIIVDEGHRAKSIISIDFLKDLNPSFLIEYTATPRPGSNILVNISSQELKKSQMVKIPLVLESKKDWKEVVDDGVEQRISLEKLSKKDKDYIRPIALLQAEPDRGANSITVEVIKDYLIKERGIKEEEIAIKISNKNELEGLNLFSKHCKIKYIITISALAEGWDCSFAYVLVSVSNLGSKIAVEQILGRIIRMPYAEKRQIDELNKSYVFASAKNFQEAADSVIKGLQENGYSKNDVVSKSEEKEKDPHIGEKRFEKFGVPIISCKGRKLQFGEDLLGADFELSKQDYKIDFQKPVSEDGKGEIDINEEGEWAKGVVKQLRLLNLHNSAETIESLVRWLDKHIRLIEIDQKDKLGFINKCINYLIDEKKMNFNELSLNRYPLKEKLAKQIKLMMQESAKKSFDILLSENKINLAVYDYFPETIELTKEVLNQEYQKSYYSKVEKLNNEEKAFLDKIDLDELENIKFWIRCREKQADSFSLQGWENRRVYPDFVALTKSGNILVFEWKGEHLVDSEDTRYKAEIGGIWQKLGNGKLSFNVVTNENVDQILEYIKLK